MVYYPQYLLPCSNTATATPAETQRTTSRDGHPKGAVRAGPWLDRAAGVGFWAKAELKIEIPGSRSVGPMRLGTKLAQEESRMHLCRIDLGRAYGTSKCSVLSRHTLAKRSTAPPIGIANGS